MARAALVIEARAKGGAKVRDLPAHALGRLLDCEPRVVLPRYQRLLPTGAEALLRRHRESAPTRITLTVESADSGEAAVRYRVVFPAYPGLIKAWQEEQKKPRVPLPDDFSHVKPTYALAFLTFPTTESFELSSKPPAIPADRRRTGPLSFDKQAMASGRIALPWSGDVSSPRELYLTAKLVSAQPYVPVEPIPAQDVYVEPVLVTVQPAK